MILASSMTPSSAPPSSLVTLYQPSRVCSEAHFALTSSLSGSMGYLSSAGAASGSAAEPVPALQPARPTRPAAMALPAMKPLRVMSLMVFSLALPGGPLRPLFKLQLSQWEGV